MPVEIREHFESDFETYYEWQSDPAIAAFVSWLPKTREQSQEGLRDAILQQAAKRRVRYFFAVTDSLSKQVLGEVGFTVIEEGVGDCGWFILRRFWGKGYATEAARRMVAVAFGAAGLHRLQASCARANVASQRVMEKCGFLCMGQTETRRQYSLLKSDWQKKSSPGSQ
jgi:[ribosomal protein S5]-alanine N-acetyltransferase